MRACQAALRQLQNFSHILVELAGKYADIEMLQMGWGITTGPIILSQFGSRAADLAMVGDCVNLASRLAGLGRGPGGLRLALGAAVPHASTSAPPAAAEVSRCA